MKIRWSQIYYNEEERIPRKIKKHLFGNIPSRNKLRERIANVTIDAKRCLNHEFCPKCGCDMTRTFDHRVAYPEIWETDYCMRCGYEVGGADNSPHYHVLEEIIIERNK